MSRASARFRFDRALVEESSVRLVEPVDDDLVDAQVNSKSVAVRLIQHDTVRVWALLAIGIDAATAVLHDADGFSQTTIVFDWENGSVATLIMGEQNELARSILCYVARCSTFRRSLVAVG